MSTTWRENSFKRIFKARRERTKRHKSAALFRPGNPISGQTDFRVIRPLRRKENSARGPRRRLRVQLRCRAKPTSRCRNVNRLPFRHTGHKGVRVGDCTCGLTLVSRCVALFDHATCAISGSGEGLALEGIDLPFRAALPNYSTRRRSFTQARHPSIRGSHPLWRPVPGDSDGTCGNFSGTSSLKFRGTKGSIGHTFMVCIHTENQNQGDSVTGVSSGAPLAFQPGINSFKARGSNTLPDRMCEPTSAPFSTMHTLNHFTFL